MSFVQPIQADSMEDNMDDGDGETCQMNHIYVNIQA